MSPTGTHAREGSKYLDSNIEVMHKDGIRFNQSMPVTNNTFRQNNKTRNKFDQDYRPDCVAKAIAYGAHWNKPLYNFVRQ